MVVLEETVNPYAVFLMNAVLVPRNYSYAILVAHLGTFPLPQRSVTPEPSKLLAPYRLVHVGAKKSLLGRCPFYSCTSSLPRASYLIERILLTNVIEEVPECKTDSLPSELLAPYILAQHVSAEKSLGGAHLFLY